MKLYAKMSSERGKEVTKSGNEFIEINITNGYKNYAKLFISSEDGFIELENGNGDMIYRANAVEFSKD